jgi:hypothetical protein
MTIAALSTVEDRPADLVAQPLVVEDEFADRIRELFALPTTFEPSGAFGLACGRRRPRSLDRIGCSAQLVCSDMRHHRGLASGECRVTSRSAQHPCRSHGMAARCAGPGHPDLAASPCPDLLDRLTRPRICGPLRLEKVQNVLRARGRPQRQEPVIGIRERPPAADGDEPGVTVFGQDHHSTVKRCSISHQRRVGRPWRHVPTAGQPARRCRGEAARFDGIDESLVWRLPFCHDLLAIVGQRPVVGVGRVGRGRAALRSRAGR